VQTASNRLFPIGASTVTHLLACGTCSTPIRVSYEFQGRDRKNVYKCPHCLQLGQIDLPGPIVLPAQHES
jgi:hypothetical protein